MNTFTASTRWLQACLAIAFVITPRLLHAEVDATPKHPVEMADYKLTLTGDDNQPVSEAKVRIYAMRCEQDPASHYSWPTDNAGPAPQGTTNEKGEFTFQYPVKFGAEPDWRTTTQLSIAIRHPEYVSYSLHVDPRDGKSTTVLNAGCELAISARDENGQTINDFGVIMAGPGRSAAWQTQEGMKRSRAIPDGHWQTMLVMPNADGDHLFSGVLPVRLADSQNVKLRNVTLRPGLHVVGKLADDVTRPVARGKVIAWCIPKPAGRVHDEKDPSLSWCDSVPIAEDGTFEFPSLPRTGMIQFLAICDGWIVKDDISEAPRPGFKTGRLVDVSTMIADDGSSTDLVLDMEATGSIEVTVKTSEGKPLAGAQVATWPNQALHLSGTQILGDCYPSLEEVRAQLDSSINQDLFKRQAMSSHYFQTTNQAGIAILRNIPLKRSESLAVDHEGFIVANGEADGLDRNLRFTCETTELKTIEINMKARPKE